MLASMQPPKQRGNLGRLHAKCAIKMQHRSYKYRFDTNKNVERCSRACNHPSSLTWERRGVVPSTRHTLRDDTSTYLDPTRSCYDCSRSLACYPYLEVSWADRSRIVPSTDYDTTYTERTAVARPARRRREAG